MENIGPTTAEKLNQFIARIERLGGEKDELTADIREVYSEMKSFGFDTKVVRQIVKDRKKDDAELSEFEALIDTYKAAITT